ncbi:D-ribose pyranase [Raineyella antarctica]|uniref:D-ribose pyranase n=1 Tax=Raineyella antarctica TaxID=1577474 RepID=A0A1G6GJ27_9ACTN|nr:D-ribose pyranase [Raineyella antarctica]SDB81833.1 D-ribose pyranase [Raineyella antarctica]
MKKHGLLNPDLNRAVARLGHTDLVVVADCGLPVPAQVPVIDLALVFGIPRFTEVLDALLAEIVVEAGTAAEEVRGTEADGWLTSRLLPLDAPLAYIPHVELKHRVAGAAFVVRTGETTPYANVLLRCGVPF